jgi:Spy/CpxP family protein refolding chaperone
MNHIRTALVAAMLAVGTVAVASAQQTTATTPAPRAEHQHQRGGHRGAGMHARKQLFNGMTLSAAEQANVKAVQAKYASRMKAQRQQEKPQFEALRAARQRGDSAAVKQLRAQMRTQFAAQRAQSKALMQQERNDLRAALTPANQTKFDANVAKLRERVANRAQKSGAWRGETGGADRP